MQTFLAYPDFAHSALVLDRARLGKQRVEVKQILNALTGQSKGWVNHPAVRMWRGYEPVLAVYGWVVCWEWKRRGYKDSLSEWFYDLSRGYHKSPPWLGDPDFHLSHQSNLIRKMPEHYGPLFPGVPDDLPYIWPVQ